MSDETISTLERLWAADEERRRVGASVGAPRVRPVPTANELKQAARLEAARALPDSMFLEDAHAQVLQATYDARLSVSTNQSSIKRWLMEERERLTAQIQDAVQSLAWAALSDGAGKDATFAIARAELAAMESDKALVQAREVEKKGLMPQAQVLSYQRALLDAVNLLTLRRQDLELARAELRPIRLCERKDI